MHAPPAKICDTCGSSLDLEAPSGFCPACLLSTALNGSGEEANTADASIADYEILSEIARGGMGIVYRARQRIPVRVVALKMILPAHISSPGAIARFRAEAEAAASLDHPAILPVYAVGEKDGAPFYSMKFAEGGSLAARLAAFRDKPRESANLIAKLARAVAHAHERGILHRDLKPGNVLFDGTDKPFVSDFGLAKWLERECDLTQTLAILGTPHYMAPEQASGAGRLTPAADIYSLGAILFHLLTGRAPFRGDNAIDVLRQAAERPAPRPRTLNRKVPADLETICLKCLEKKKAARYPSASVLADDLERFLARRTILARRAHPITHAVRWARRNPSIALLGAASVALLVALVLVLRPAVPPRAKETEKSIAVLPFEDLGTDKTSEFFASSMHEDVLVSLSRIADLKVISRNSVMQYRGIGRDLREIGRALDVSAFLEGSVRRDGTRAHINVQLIKAADGAQIWAENYDREIKDAFAIQSEVALHIASALKARLSSLETARLQAAPTKSSEAYLRFIEAKNLYADYRKLQPDLDKAERLYQEAIALDPGFALAYARLSQLHNIYYEDYDTTPARREKARAAAREALRLDPDLPEGHLALALDYWRPNANTGEIDYEKALAEFSIAQRGLPNDAEIYGLIGQVERHQGKWVESTAHLKKAVSLDPNSVERWHRLFYNYELTRNYASAAVALERTIALAPPEDRWTYQWHRSFLNFFRNGDLSEIERIPAPPPNDVGRAHSEEMFGFKMLLRKYDEAEKILLSDRREIFWWGNMHGAPKSLLLGRLYSRSGERAKGQAQYEVARVSLEQVIAARPRDADAHINLAEAYAGLDRKNDAIGSARLATEIIPESKDPWYGADELSKLAQIYVMVGEFDLALPIIEHCLATVSPIFRSQLRFQPAWDPLRNDPRFQELIARPDVVIPVGELETPPPSENAENDNRNKSIAVLPFENLSDDKSNDYFASGIHDDVLANLSRLGQLKVISPNSVLPYKGAQRNLREIGHALGVRTLLEGNVRRAGNRVHIHVQLIDATNDAQIWAESFDREMTDLFSVQSDLAVRIAAALQVKLSPAERASIETPPTRDAEAYDFYLRGRELLHGIAGLGQREENLSTAIDLLNRAVARDPNFALGYCLLAELHLARFRVSRVASVLSSHDPADLEKVRSNLEIALRLAPDLGEAHLVRGMYFYHGVSDYQRASVEFAIARRALPNNGECFHLSGLLERRLGRWSEGLHYQIKAVSLDPQNATAREDLASTYYLNRNFAEAERVLDQAILAIPEHANFFRVKKAQVGLMKGDLDRCRAALESLPPDYEYDGMVRYYRALLALYFRDFAEADRILVETVEKLGPKKTEWWVPRYRALVARAEGDRAKTDMAFQTALRVESEMRKRTPDDPGVLSMIALFQAALGRKEEALREIGKAVELLPITVDAIAGPALAKNQALVYAWCGERDRALEQLAVLAKIPSGPDPGELRFDPAWDTLRGDARFDEILAAAAEPIKIE